MNWDWEIFRSIALAVSAGLAALTFLVATLSTRAKDRADEVREWQKVVIAELFQSKADETLMFDEILRAYQAEANEYSKFKLKPGVLSRESLRRIIVDLIGARVIDQISGDEYRLMTVDRYLGGMNVQESLSNYLEKVESILHSPNSTQDKIMAALGKLTEDAGEKNQTAFDVSAEVVNQVHDAPGKYRNSDLVLAISQQMSAPPPLVKMQVNMAIAAQVIQEDELGLLWPPRIQVKEAE